MSNRWLQMQMHNCLRSLNIWIHNITSHTQPFIKFLPPSWQLSTPVSVILLNYHPMVNVSSSQTLFTPFPLSCIPPPLTGLPNVFILPSLPLPQWYPSHIYLDFGPCRPHEHEAVDTAAEEAIKFTKITDHISPSASDNKYHFRSQSPFFMVYTTAKPIQQQTLFRQNEPSPLVFFRKKP